VPLFVTVLTVSAGHEHADCTVYGDRGAVMSVTVTQEYTAALLLQFKRQYLIYCLMKTIIIVLNNNNNNNNNY